MSMMYPGTTLDADPTPRFLPSDVDTILERVNDLRDINRLHVNMRQVIRAILNGGAEAVQYLVADSELQHLPSANLIHSAIERIAQKLITAPSVRVDAPRKSDTAGARKKAEKRERIVEAYDAAANVKMQVPQAVRWLAGYGFVPWVISPAESIDGQPFPRLELRDPFSCLPGPWSIHQQPMDIAFIRRIPESRLRSIYPQIPRNLRRTYHVAGTGSPSSAVATDGIEGSNWEVQDTTSMLRVVEYRNATGTYLLLEDGNMLLDYEPCPEGVGTPFVVSKRFAFDRLIGQFDHVIGLQQMIARMNILAFLAVQDSVFAEALALDTPIPTPTGWTTMGALSEGDLILGADGLPVEVLEVKDTQLDRQCYRLTFEGGDSIVASDGHLWMSRVIGQGAAVTPKVRTTQQMVDDGRRFRVPAPQPWKLPARDLVVDPYVLGAWLGDGSATSAIICAGDADFEQMRSQIHGCGYATKEMSTRDDRAGLFYVSMDYEDCGFDGAGLHGRLRMMGLLGNKRVPDEYLWASIDQRLALLQGLMDTDGTASKSGHCSFTNSNERIIDAVMHLLRSLGEIPSKNWTEDERSRNGGYWHVTFTARQFNPFRLPRKRDRVHMHKQGADWITIRSIEPVESVPVRCIAVASDDHLFLAGLSGMVTHNTNVYGEMTQSEKYKRGRGAVNHFTQGTHVEKPNDPGVFQSFQQQDRIERQLRLTGAYPVTDDAQSPNSFVTGRGLEELTSASDNVVREYELVIEDTFERADAKRLCWDEKAWGEMTRALPGHHRGEPYVETYTPTKDIRGAYRTRRIHGLLSGLDSSARLVGLLQLSQAEFIDNISAMENIDGIDDVQLVRDRMERQKAAALLEQAMLSLLQGQAQFDDRVIRVLVDTLEAGPLKDRYEKVFFPEEKDITAPPAPEPEPLAQPGEDATTVLSRLFSGGQNTSAVQTVQTV